MSETRQRKARTNTDLSSSRKLAQVTSPDVTTLPEKPADLSAKLAELSTKLAEAREKERETLQYITNLERQQQQFFDERRDFLLKLKKSRGNNLTVKLDKKTQKLKEEVDDLSATYAHLYDQNQSLIQKLSDTDSIMLERLNDAQTAVENADNRLKAEISNQKTRDSDIKRLTQQIQQMNTEIESLDADRSNYAKKKQETEHESEKIRETIQNQRAEMQQLQRTFDEVRQQYDALNSEKERRKKSQNKKNQYDESQLSQLTETVNQLKEEREEYERKIAVIEDEEMPDLNAQIKRATDELNHLVELHEMRKRQKKSLEDALSK